MPKGRWAHNRQRLWCGKQGVGWQDHYCHSKAVPHLFSRNGLPGCKGGEAAAATVAVGKLIERG